MSKFRTFVASTTLAGLSLVVAPAFGQTPNTITQRSEEIAANSRAAAAGRSSVDSLLTSTSPRAVAKVSGIASPGLKLTLDGSGSSGGRVWYRWIQTQGSRVKIQGFDQAVATFVVPDDATNLGFVLVVGSTGGVDARSLIVEVEETDQDDSDVTLKADAGGDQSAVVGRRVVLDGIKSEPKGRVRYRWVQSGGPKATITTTAGSSCSFTPETPGTYQFALLVLGANDLVSEASVVTVAVKHPSLGPEARATDRPAMAIDEMARTSLMSIPGSSRYVGKLAGEFDLMAARADSFKNYFEMISELTHRLDMVVPREVGRRAEWMDQFFKPWMGKIALEMRPTGVDFDQPVGQVKVLSKAQRARLVEQLRFTAAGLRVGTRTR